MWTYDRSTQRWRHSGGTQVTADVIDRYPRTTIQAIAVQMAGESLPDDAWPPPDPVSVMRMFMAAHEVRRQLAEVDDVRELYPENRGER